MNGALWCLARTECRWVARRAIIWLGAACSVLIAIRPSGDFQGSAYSEKLVSVFPLGLAAFVVAMRAGARDGGPPERALAPAAPIGPAGRTVAKALSLAVPVGLAAVLAAAIAVVSRIEGGFWMGLAPRRTDAALHPVVLLLQLPLSVFAVGAIGVLAGAVVPGRLVVVVSVVSAAVLLWGSLLWWLWNVPPLHVVALYQVQPFEVVVPGVATYADTPPHWLVIAPDRFTGAWRRLVVHRPSIIAHDVYLAALGAMLCAAATRSRRGWYLAGGGAVLAVAAVAVQLAVYPSA